MMVSWRALLGVAFAFCLAAHARAGVIITELYGEIPASEIFVVGTLEKATPHVGGDLLVWRVRVEEVVKGSVSDPFVYVATVPQYQEHPFGKGRKTGSRVFLALETTGLSVPDKAKPAEARTQQAEVKCYKTSSFLGNYLSKSDNYFRCAILYYQTRKERFDTKAKWKDLHKEVKTLLGHIEEERGMASGRVPSEAIEQPSPEERSAVKTPPSVSSTRVPYFLVGVLVGGVLGAALAMMLKGVRKR